MADKAVSLERTPSHPVIQTAPGRSRILLAHDRQILLDMLCGLLEPEFEVVGQANDGCTLLDVAGRLSPDIVLIKPMMPGFDGLEAVRELRARAPALKLIYLTTHTDPNLAAAAFAAGASAFLSKSCSAAELRQAIRIVAGGGRYLSADIAAGNVETLMLAHRADPVGRLSTRELEVLQLLVAGLPMKSVARCLGITARTVAFHKYRVKEILGLKDNAELVDFAIRHGLLGSRAAALEAKPVK
ncbi:MAG TPA: response regulator transcription factor [Acetobacteraceae bacterium]|nr:response regulator transcription factor [Acetobacteraceae bacterium]